jgi:hypothetical protein
VFAAVAALLETIEFVNGRVSCFNRYSIADEEAYVGIQTLAAYFFNNDSSKEADLLSDLTLFCS